MVLIIFIRRVNALYERAAANERGGGQPLRAVDAGGAGVGVFRKIMMENP